MSDLDIQIQDRLWQRGQLEATAEFYEHEARRPASNPVYAAFCAAQAKRMREHAEGIDEDTTNTETP